jgi:ABC-type phosphate/phosphonate transport system substrate-binding protein
MDIKRRGMRVLVPLILLAGCAPRTTEPTINVGGDPTAPKPVAARDLLEQWARDRGVDFKLVDKLVDPFTPVPAFDREPLPPPAPDARLSADIAALDDTEPFPRAVPLPAKDVTIRVGLAHSTYRTREPEEVLSAAQPFIDLTQREVNVRGAPVLHEKPDEIYYALVEGQDQMVISHVFDYLLVRSWFADVENNGTILLGWAQPARPRVTELDREFPGPPGTCIELIVARDAKFKNFADLKGARLALAANYIDAPGTFLTRLLMDAGQPREEPYFDHVTLRRFPKDAVLDVLKGKADVACVDQSTIAALDRFYGLQGRVRTLAISPRYNVDVLYTSENNVATHRTEIELTQRQLTTLAKNPEGQEVLFFFDEEGWHNYREDDIAAARAHFDDFLKFWQETPVDLRPLLDPQAPIDRRTYDRLGDE